MTLSEMGSDVLAKLSADVKAAWDCKKVIVDDAQTPFTATGLPAAQVLLDRVDLDFLTPVSDSAVLRFSIAGSFKIPSDQNMTAFRLAKADEMRAQLMRSEQEARTNRLGYGGHGFLVKIDSVDIADPATDKGVVQVALTLSMQCEVPR